MWALGIRRIALGSNPSWMCDLKQLTRTPGFGILLYKMEIARVPFLPGLGNELLLLLLLSHFSCVRLCATLRQPTRLPRPWDSPGKNTEVGCHSLLQCMKVKSESEVAQLCLTLSDPTDCSLPGSSIHGIFQARVLEWGAIAFSWE